MNTKNESAYKSTDDQTLRWSMRLLGIIVALGSIVLLTHDIFQSTMAISFLGASAGVGLITLVASWMPDHEKESLKESVVMQSRSNS